VKKEPHKNSFETIHFKSKDGLLITADVYPVKQSKDLILLCHRSHCNRGEYRETAPKLNKLGFSCLAIDQRSGMKVFGVINETSARAKQNGLPTGYLDAKQDIESAVDYAYELNHKKPIIILGSSYSASLALLISTQSEKIKAVIVFSPGEYLKGVKLAEEIKLLEKPIFATGARKEIDEVSKVIRFINPKNVTLFKPKVDGFHGSKTLWESVEGYEAFWETLEKFLSKFQN
jgi:alpha-beta hydrolase superfamily lysophospholipase